MNRSGGRWALGAVVVVLATGIAAPRSVQGTAAWAAPAVRVLVDDVPLTVTPPPTVIDDRLYLPLRPLGLHFGAGVTADRGTVTVTRADGTAFVLRPGRREVWSGTLVWALLDVPVQMINGSTFIPASGVDVLFGVLSQWNGGEQQFLITTTQTAFHAETAAKPPASAAAPTRVSPAGFTPEFVPDTQRPVVASGYVTVGVAVGGPSDARASAQAQFSTHEGPDRTDGTIALTAASSALQASGTVTVRSPVTILTVGALTLHDSPLTMYQQGLSGVLYENMAGPGQAAYFGGDLTTSGGGSIYGMSLQLPQHGEWTFETGLLYAADTGGMILKTRADHPLGDTLGAFAEVGAGSAGGSGGIGWRAGLSGSAGNITTSLSYLSLEPAYPAVGNAAVFTGRRGPLLELAYRPSVQWSLLASAAALQGAGLPDRATYGLLANYRASSDLGVLAELRSTEDASAGVHTRATTAQAAVTLTQGRWGLMASLSQVDDTDLLAGTTSATSTWSLRAAYTLGTGRPVWAELAQSTGATESWAAGLGWTFRVSPNADLTAALRHKIYTLPTPSSESALEIGMAQPLPTGAQLLVGAGVKYTLPDGLTVPYLTVQYGYPFYAYGTPRIGRVSGHVFADANANGVREADEPGVPGVTVRIDGRSAVQSDATGAVAVEGVREGQYVVSIDEGTVPAGFVAVQPRFEVVVATGGTSEVTFVLVPGAIVRGVVFVDENGDGRWNDAEPGVEGIVVTLHPGGENRTSDATGAFEFGHLLPGEVALAVDQTALPPDLKVGDSGVYALVLRPGGMAEVHIPLVGTKPVLKKTFP